MCLTPLVERDHQLHQVLPPPPLFFGQGFSVLPWLFYRPLYLLFISKVPES